MKKSNLIKSRTFDNMRPKIFNSWVPETHLCQIIFESSNEYELFNKVKSFNSKDSPTKISMTSQEKIEEKLLKPSYVSYIPWKFPPKVVLIPSWRVLNGEESEEIHHQNWRESRVLEAFYPRHSSIPTSSCVSAEVENEHYDDSQTPLIPSIPIEEEEEKEVSPSLATTTSSQVQSDQTSSTKPSFNLLNKILSDPQTIEKFRQNGLAITTSSQVQCDQTSSTKPSFNLLNKILSDPQTIEKFRQNGLAITTSSQVQCDQTSSTKPSFNLLNKILSDPQTIEKFRQNGLAITTSSQVQCDQTSSTKPSFNLLNKILSDPQTIKKFRQNGLAITTSSQVQCDQTSSTKPSSNLLNKILTDPQTIEKLRQNGLATTTSSQVQCDQTSSTKPSFNLLNKILSDPQTIEKLRQNGLIPPATTTTITAPVPAPAPSYVDVNSVSKDLFTTTNPMPPMKDLNYYRNLIRQHGCEKVDEHKEQSDPKSKPLNNYKPKRELRWKKLKPCIFYKTSKGCRNGDKCPYQHDDVPPTQWSVTKDLETHNAKRMRLNVQC
ncbi:hypothetical protein F8388_009265 [Cannabis sativa]|uniref:C3H1-type domain-containing protein n=1 Tax=Cannabis sativa TaxID=3483 RepID=A0A7J6GJX7_CANSA|nr:hypothetical protein F8388_009265 [Cannabis sativa]